MPNGNDTRAAYGRGACRRTLASGYLVGRVDEVDGPVEAQRASKVWYLNWKAAQKELLKPQKTYKGPAHWTPNRSNSCPSCKGHRLTPRAY